MTAAEALRAAPRAALVLTVVLWVSHFADSAVAQTPGEPEPNVEITVSTEGEPELELWFEPVVPPGEGDPEPIGAIVQPGNEAYKIATLAHWIGSGSGGRSARAYLPPGAYRTALKAKGRRGIVRYKEMYSVSDPIVVRAGVMTPVVIDLDSARELVIVARTPDGEVRRRWPTSPTLEIGAASIWIGEYAPDEFGLGSYEGERRGVLFALGDAPKEAFLSNCPGANGRRVTLRSVRPEDDAPDADLVVTIPNGRRVLGRIKSLSGGRIFGYSRASARHLESPLIRYTTMHLPSRTVQHWPKRGLFSVYLVGESTTGVLLDLK